MDIDVVREYKNKPITKNIRFLTEAQLELIQKVKDDRFLLPLKILKTYVIIEEKGENILEFLERNEKQRPFLMNSMFRYLAESSQLVPTQKWNIENIIVYNGRPLLDISSVSEEGVSMDELCNQIGDYFS